MTKQDLLQAIDNNEVTLTGDALDRVKQKIETLPDGDLSEQDEMAFDDFLVDLADEYMDAAIETEEAADVLDEMVDEIDSTMSSSTEKALDMMYSSAQSMKAVSEEA